MACGDRDMEFIAAGSRWRAPDVDLQFDSLPGNHTAAVYRLDASHGSLSNAYSAMGSPDFPTAEQIKSLNAAAELPAPESIIIHNGRLALHLAPKALVVFETLGRSASPSEVLRTRCGTALSAAHLRRPFPFWSAPSAARQFLLTSASSESPPRLRRATFKKRCAMPIQMEQKSASLSFSRHWSARC